MNCREDIIRCADEKLPVYQQIARDIHANPEVSNYEFFACKTLSERLAAEGFEVKTDIAGHRTGFVATYRAAKAGPTLAFLAEYDALPGLGHGCGHNLFAATSLLAGVCLKQVIDEVGGEVRVYGTPGEEGGENGSAKATYAREGLFDDVDAALCAHPGSDVHELTATSLALAAIDIEFHGRASHAAAAPEKGINALDAIIMVYNALNALRQHVTDDVRIHGIITHGGDAPNIVPEYASARFYLRAATKKTVDSLYAKTQAIVEGAGLQTGAKGRMWDFQNRVDNTVVTPSFDALYAQSLLSLGEELPDGEPHSVGSTDVGNVSQVIPVIHPMIRISDKPVAGHSIEKREASVGEIGLSSIAVGAKALALTALELIEKPDVLAAIKADHAEQVKNQ